MSFFQQFLLASVCSFGGYDKRSTNQTDPTGAPNSHARRFDLEPIFILFIVFVAFKTALRHKFGLGFLPTPPVSCANGRLTYNSSIYTHATCTENESCTRPLLSTQEAPLSVVNAQHSLAIDFEAAELQPRRRT